MRFRSAALLAWLTFTQFTLALAPDAGMKLPKTIVAGDAFSIPTTGRGKAVLYIVGLGQALRRDVQMGESALFPTGVLYNAGHYLAILVGPSSQDTGAFDVIAGARPETLGFLAKPSRLPVGLHNGISGAVYVFDAYRNLMTTPTSVSFELSVPAGAIQSRSVMTRNGLAWAEMDSSAKEGTAKFVARVGDASSTRIIEEVPGEPCRIMITARPNGKKLEVQTAPVRDCSGNAIPDGTVVTFTQSFNDTQTTVDVPLKEGVARVDMPANKGSRISVACGVVAGNEIRWNGGQ